MINNKEEFKTKIEEITHEAGYREPIGFGICKSVKGTYDPTRILVSDYAVVNWGENNGSAAIFQRIIRDIENNVNDENTKSKFVHKTENEVVYELNDDFITIAKEYFAPYIEEALISEDKHQNVKAVIMLDDIIAQIKQHDIANMHYRIVFMYTDIVPETIEGIYLKLYALSMNKASLRSLNLDGIFGKLTNVAWAGNVPIELEILRKDFIGLKLSGQYPFITSIDKFPNFLSHVIPADNTRILDQSKVRMGAQLAAGTTVMPGASYINFNAGTKGPVMVEGRISSSAIVGANSDVGGGASILGVLSGTDGNPISIGEKCLLGANSVTGIPLGDACIIDAGTTILANTPVFVTMDDYDQIMEVNIDCIKDTRMDEDGMEFYAKEFAGMNGLHFRLDVTEGRIVLMRSTREVVLNKELH